MPGNGGFMDYTTSSKEIGQRIRASRKAMGLTQAETAELLNLSVNYVSDLENGKKTCPR